MAQLNYRPSAIARSLATSSSNMMGLLVTYYTGGFFGEMMEQVQTELDMHHKFLITAQGHHSAQGERGDTALSQSALRWVCSAQQVFIRR